MAFGRGYVCVCVRDEAVFLNFLNIFFGAVCDEGLVHNELMNYLL